MNFLRSSQSQNFAQGRSPAQPSPQLPFPVVGIGGSAEAFAEFLNAVPQYTGMAFVFVLHSQSGSKDSISRLLSVEVAVTVSQAEEGVDVERDHAYIAMPGRRLTIREGCLRVGEVEPDTSHRGPMDVFFCSLAEDRGHNAICVVLEGVEGDGIAGAEAIRAVGGICLLQASESASAPGSERSGMGVPVADYILHPSKMPEALVAHVRRAGMAVGGDEQESKEGSELLATMRARVLGLETANNDLNSLLSSTNFAVLSLDQHFCIRQFTPAIRDLLELIPTDVGRPLKDLAKKFTDSELISHARDVLETFTAAEKEIVSDSGRLYLRRILPYRTPQGRVDGLVITFVEVARRLKADKTQWEGEESYRLMVERVKDHAIMMLDTQGLISTWNPAAESMLGYCAREVVGQHFSMLFTAGDRALGIPYGELREATAAGESSTEGWRVRKDGTRLWGSGNLSLIRDNNGNHLGFVKVVRDITERKRAEEVIKIACRTAEEANEAKDQFLTTVSHELRTPLSTILLWSQMINSKLCSSDKIPEAMETIQANAEAQRRLIEDLLDTSRIASGKLALDIEETDPAGPVGAAVQAAQPAAASKHLQLFQHIGPGITSWRIDAHRFLQVASNLIANAIKFTPEGGRVDVSLRQNAEGLELEVRDTGKGIDPEFLPRIFDRFTQAEDARTRSYGGLGLGL